MKYFLFFCAALLPFCMLAQTAEINPNGYLAVNLGAAIPQGGFDGTTLSYNQLGIRNGFAKTGSVIGISGGYVTDRIVGIAGSFSYASNGLDEAAMEKAFRNFLPFGFILPVEMKVKAENYSATSLSAGLLIAVPYNRVSFDFRWMAGVSFIHTPELTLTFQDTGSTSSGLSLIIGKSSATAVHLQVGVGVRFILSKSLCLLGNVDYITANRPAYDAQSISSSSAGNPIPIPGISLNIFEPSYQQLFLSVGLGMNLFRNAYEAPEMPPKK